MEKEKREFNEFLLDMEEQLEAAVRRENDPLEAAAELRANRKLY